MPEPFKNLFNPEVIAEMAGHIGRACAEQGVADFDESAFVDTAVRDLDALELKERSAQIRTALTEHLRVEFPVAAAVLGAALNPADDVGSDPNRDQKGIHGIALMPVADYVASHGMGHFDLALGLLREITKRSSSEFAIRPFLVAEQKRTLDALSTWVEDPDPHVRRLVSEGTRPRLPWGLRLSSFVEDPSPVLPLLESLRDDPSEYVRRSVANNLNDIAKDHPELVASIAARWLVGASDERRRLVRHACRTLVKQGHPAALEALGYLAPQVSLESFVVLSPTVRLGEALSFEVALRSTTDADQKLMLDYVLHHRRANGKTTPKVFKWKDFTLKVEACHEAKRRHPIKRITTRTYYPGTHFVELQVNGRVMGREAFELEL